MASKPLIIRGVVRCEGWVTGRVDRERRCKRMVKVDGNLYRNPSTGERRVLCRAHGSSKRAHLVGFKPAGFNVGLPDFVAR